MEAIINNPFRVLGVLSNAKASEIKNNRNKIKAFIEAEQEIELDYDFPVLGHLERTEGIINTAISVLNLDHDKILTAYFGFIMGIIQMSPLLTF